MNVAQNLRELFEVDLGLGLTVIGFEQLVVYFGLLLNLLPSYLRSR